MVCVEREIGKGELLFSWRSMLIARNLFRERATVLSSLAGGAAWLFLLFPMLRMARSLFGFTGGCVVRWGGILLAGLLAGAWLARSGALSGRRIRSILSLIPLFSLFLLFLFPGLAESLPPAPIFALLLLVAGFGIGLTGALQGEHEAAPPAAFMGVAAGAFLAGRVVLPAIGTGGSLWIAAGLFFLAWLPSLSAPRWEEARDEPTIGNGGGLLPVALSLLLVGAIAPAWITGWNRLLDLIVGPTFRTTALLAALPAFGIGVGILIRRFFTRSLIPVIIWCCTILIMLILGVVLSLVDRLPWQFVLSVHGRTGIPDVVLGAGVRTAVLLILPLSIPLGLIAGALLGALRDGCGEERRKMAAMSFFLPAAGALGALLLIPARLPSIGAIGMMKAGAVPLLLLSLVMLFREAGTRPFLRYGGAGLLLLVCAGLFVIPTVGPMGVMNAGVYRYAEEFETMTSVGFKEKFAPLPVFTSEGRVATVIVSGEPGARLLTSNGLVEVSDGNSHLPLQILLARLPNLFRPDAKDALILGAGAGITHWTLLYSGIDSIVCVEPEPARLAAMKHFETVNMKPWENERMQFVTADPRSFLRESESVDLILSMGTSLSARNSAHLHTSGFFRLAASRLREGGILVYPVPLAGIREEHLRSLLNDFHKSFPHLLGFRAAGLEQLILLGSDSPLTLDARYLQALWKNEGLSSCFEAARVSRPEELVTLALLDGETVERYAGGARANDDADGFVEYGAELARFDRMKPRLSRMLRGLKFDCTGFLSNKGMLPREEAAFHLEAARVCRRRGYGAQGLLLAGRSYQIDPSSEAAEVYGHFIRTERGNIAEAIAVVEKALEKDPRNPLLIRRLGDYYHMAHQFSGCEDLMTRMIDAGFKEAWLYTLRGKAKLAMRRWQEALDDLFIAKKIDRLQDRRGNINFLLGLAYQGIGDLEESKNYLGRTVQRNPRHRLAMYKYGECKMLLGQIDRAEFDQNFLIPFNRARAESLFAGAEKDFFREERAREVEINLITVLNSTPNHLGAYFLLAEFYMRQGKVEKERGVLRRIVEHFGTSEEIRNSIAIYCYRTGRRPEDLVDR